jgi:hypothetical protein
MVESAEQPRQEWQDWLFEQQVRHELQRARDPDQTCLCAICTPDKIARKCDLQAEINVLTAEEGGRRSYFTAGYRPIGQCDGINFFTMMVPSTERVFPGDRLLALFTVLSPEILFGRLLPGTDFLLHEGSPSTVARCRVTMLLGLSSWPQSTCTFRWRSNTSSTLSRAHIGARRKVHPISGDLLRLYGNVAVHVVCPRRPKSKGPCACSFVLPRLMFRHNPVTVLGANPDILIYRRPRPMPTYSDCITQATL